MPKIALKYLHSQRFLTGSFGPEPVEMLGSSLKLLINYDNSPNLRENDISTLSDSTNQGADPPKES